MARRLAIIQFTLAGMILQACSTQAPTVSETAEAEDSPASIRVLSDAEVISGSREALTPRLMADLLFEGLQALDADRLLTPVDDSAHARFMRVLAYDSDNEIALQGLEDIVLRYVELAEEATNQGLFEDAEQMLDRARFVNAEHPAIEVAWQGIQAERNSGDLFFDLDYYEFSNRTAVAEQQLADIAVQARKHQAFFLITAPNDDLARWMFGIMRGAVNGYRLRGNIEMASRVSVRLRMPTD